MPVKIQAGNSWNTNMLNMYENKVQAQPTRYQLLVFQTKDELKRVREVINKAQLQEQALTKSLEILQQVNFSEMPEMSSQSILELGKNLQGMTMETIQVEGYPYNGKKEEKVLFVLKRENVAMRIPEMVTAIIKIEGSTMGDKTAKSLNYIMNQMVADGILIIGKANKSNKHTFYFLPEFFSSLEKGDMEIKPEHLPKEDTWGKLPEERRNFNRTKWIMFLKDN